MKKIIIKHIFFIFLIGIFIVSMWSLFIYEFFGNELKKNVFPVISQSKQILSEVVTKDFAKDKIKSFLSDFEKSREILYFSLGYRNKEIYYNNNNNLNKKDTMLSVLKLSYPIKDGKQIIGWVNIWPSYELFVKTLFNRNNLGILLISAIVLLIVFIIISYVYVVKYVVNPLKQITMVINDITSDSDSDLADLPLRKSMWKNIFVDLKKLKSKVIDVNTTMKLLFSATNVMTSDLELSNSVHLLFLMIQKKKENTICALFMPSENGNLKAVAKTGYMQHNVKSVSAGSQSQIWTCYEKCSEIIVNDIDSLTRDEFEFFEGQDSVSQVNMPLIDENNKCIGVLSISSKVRNCFDSDAIETIRVISKYLATLIIRMDDYKKLKEKNRKLETEIQITSKELIQTNAMLIKKVRDIKAISDISAYASAKFDMENIIGFIIEKIKEILAVETAGVFIYSNTQNDFYSVSGSFGIYEVLKFGREENQIFNEIYKTKKSVILKDKEEIRRQCLELAGKLDINSAIISPAKGEQNIVAVVAAINKIGMNFTESDVRVLEHIAIVISSIIEKIKLYNKLKTDLKKE